MEKLNIIVVPEKVFEVEAMAAHCGKFNEQLCGMKQCSFNGTAKDD